VLRAFEDVHAASERAEDHITGLPTGFQSLDWYTAGFHPGDLVICAGRPGMGKTAFALNLALNGCRARGTGALFCSLEMPKEQLAKRLLCSEARVDGNKMRSGRLAREDWAPLAKAANDVSELSLWLDDTPGLTVMELRGKARRLKADGNLGLIVVDYVQLMRSGMRTESREQEISEISRSLKAIAKELSLPVIALSQLNRQVETRGTKLRESGALEQDADTILFVYRDEVYNPDSPDQGIAEIIIGKQRAGPTGTVKCRFLREYTRFENLEERRMAPGESFESIG
jgi:replicative DNA helicase